MTRRHVLLFLIAAFVAIGVVSIASTVYSVSRIQRDFLEAPDFHTTVLFEILSIDNKIKEAVQEGFAYVLSGEVVEREEFFALSVAIDSQLAGFTGLAGLDTPGEERERAVFERIVSHWQGVVAAAPRMFADYEATGALSPALFHEYEGHVDQLSLALGELVQIEEREVEAAQADALALVDKAQTLLWREGLLTFVLALIAAALVARVIDKVFEARKELERQLLQSQKMDAVGQLAGGIAHDFNNYLTVIGGAARLAAEGDPEDARRWMHQILEAGDRTAALTRQLLAFARRQVLDPHDLDPNEVVAGLLPLLRRTIGENIVLDFVPVPDIGIVSADLSQLEQVITNLVLNARDAMPDGGTITIETGDVMLSEEYADNHPGVTPGRHTMLAISDTGTGVDPAIRDRIFEPFVTTKAADKGTGLGLSMVYGIVTQSGGTITVNTKTGHGTTFKMYFPCTESVAATEAAPQAQPDLEGEGIILLVEDDDMVRTVTRAMLETLGFDVLEAENGRDALGLLRECPEVRLLFTDITMPVMGGVELAEKARAIKPDLDVLYMSGYTQNGIVRHGQVDAGYVLLQKPFTTAELQQKLGEALTPVARARARANA